MVLIATQVKWRRGTTAENDAFTGAEGEIVVDTETHQLRTHDGNTKGGFIIPTQKDLKDSIVAERGISDGKYLPISDSKGFALTGLSNITAAGKEVCANMPMPSSLTINIPIGASGTEYTAPADGYYYAYVTANNTGGWMNITNMTAGSMSSEGTGWVAGAIPKVFMPVSKGSKVRLYYDAVTVNYFKFCYAEGAK